MYAKFDLNTAHGNRIDRWVAYHSKVENISKGSLDSIPSPSPSDYSRESLLEVYRPNIAGRCQQTLENKKFVDITQKCLPQVNFPANNLNFH